MDHWMRGSNFLLPRDMQSLGMLHLQAYLRAVRGFACYLRRPPDTATAEELRLYQLYLVERGISPISLNATITGLKFFFDVTVGRADAMAKMSPVHVPRRLPVVLSRAECARLIACASNLKHQAALSLAYGAGLRVSEVVALKVSDIDSQRMTLRIDQGKGHKDHRRSFQFARPAWNPRVFSRGDGCDVLVSLLASLFHRQVWEAAKGDPLRLLAP